MPLSEEHGLVAHGGRRPEIGKTMQVFPNHACTVVNLARELVVIDARGGMEYWPVDARGCVS